MPFSMILIGFLVEKYFISFIKGPLKSGFLFVFCSLIKKITWNFANAKNTI